ncbi:MAG: ABC transporter permease [Halanaeroarchaeum sp.]
MAVDQSPDADDIQSLDWDELSQRRLRIPWRLVGAVLGVLAVAAYALSGRSDPLFAWSPSTLTWVYRASLVVILALGLPPLLRAPGRTRRQFERLLSRPAGVVGVLVTGAFVLVGLFGPLLVGRPHTNIRYNFQPPLLGTVPSGTVALNCVGSVTGPAASPVCHGSWQYPLGTTKVGQDMVTLLVSGLHVSFQVAVIAAVLMIPLATAVGVVAGYFGGTVDDVLMRYVDVQQAVPAFVIYIVLLFVFGHSLLLLVAVFGLLNWGSIARLVRSETIQRRQEQYVEVARSAGVGHGTIIRRHVIPNVSNSILVGTTQKIPQLVLIETALTFIDLGDVGRWFQSFGETMAAGFAGTMGRTMFASNLGGHGPMTIWWVWVIPMVALAVVVLGLTVLGDALRDVLDPRGAV